MTLPVPSEFIGTQPKWNAYPFVQVDGVNVLVGPRSEDQFKLNVWEAEAFADAIYAAIEWLKEHRS